MATTISSGTLYVTIIEKLTLDGVRRGSKEVSLDASVGEVARRTLDVTHATNGTEILKFSNTAGIGAGIYDYSTLKYLRITNLDASVNLLLHLEDSDNSHDTQLVVGPKKSFILSSAIIDNQADIDNAATDSSPDYIDKITGLAETGTSAIKVEYIIFNT